VHVAGPGAVMLPPPAQVFAEFVGTVTVMLALDALSESTRNETLPAGSVNV
jgi:hypothetical protein